MTQEEKDAYLVALKQPYVAASAVVLFKKDTTYSSAGVIIYRSPLKVMELLSDAISFLVDSLPDECVARFIGYIHPRFSGNFGLAIYPPPSLTDISGGFGIYAPGTSGVLVYDCASGIAECFAGSLAEDYPDPIQLSIPGML